jgi:hypothetical protein
MKTEIHIHVFLAEVLPDSSLLSRNGLQILLAGKQDAAQVE